MWFSRNLLRFEPICYLTNLATFFRNRATHPQVLSRNFTKFWYQASSYYSEHRMPSSVCIKFILYHQKWRKLPLRISSETSFFSRQHKLPALVDIALHFPQKHQSSFPLQPLVLSQLFCLHSWRTDFSACILIVIYCSFKVVWLWFV